MYIFSINLNRKTTQNTSISHVLSEAKKEIQVFNQDKNIFVVITGRRSLNQIKNQLDSITRGTKNEAKYLIQLNAGNGSNYFFKSILGLPWRYLEFGNNQLSERLILLLGFTKGILLFFITLFSLCVSIYLH